MPRTRFLRPVVALAAVPAVALLMASSAGAAPAAANAPAAAQAPAALTAAAPSQAHPTPLHVVTKHGTGVLNQPAGTSNAVEASSNWAGYVSTGSWNGAGFRYVQATFSVPSVNCGESTAGNASYPDTFDDWVGLDGVGYNFSASTSVEQIGIYGQCANGAPSYGAWWETYPDPETPISFQVSAGDAISASVYWDATRTAAQGQYDLVLTDVTTGQTFSQYEACAATTCANSSAEVITEAPAVGTATLPLADYAISNYENVAVTDRSGQRASFVSPNWVNTEVEQLDSTGSSVVSAPGPLFGGQAFSSFWYAEGNTPPSS
jgi:peptidase A4-like protein